MPDPSNSTFSSRRRGARTSMAPREEVLGLSQLEWGISLFGACIALILALVTAIQWARNLPTITTVKHVKGKACPTDYPTLVNTLCEHIVHTTRSAWEVKFFFIAIVAVAILIFTLLRKRAGVACFSVFLGIGLGLGSGLVFFFLGAWLILRAYRLQKYGEASFFASNRVAREMGQARREGREPTKSPRGTTSASAEKPASPPSPSKRYTPKKPPRRR